MQPRLPPQPQAQGQSSNYVDNNNNNNGSNSNNDHEITWYPGDDYVLTQDWVIPHAPIAPEAGPSLDQRANMPQPAPAQYQPPPILTSTADSDLRHSHSHSHSRAGNLGSQGSVEGEDSDDDSSFGQFSTLVAPPLSAAQAHSSSSSIERERNASTSDFRREAGSQALPTPQSIQFSGPTGLTSIEHIAPSGTSLRRGMACKFCRRRKLRCSGERPACSSCVKYKQECEYQPPAKVHKLQASESRVAELSDYISHGGPSIPPAFSSRPLGYDHPAPQQAMYPETYQFQPDPQAQPYQYLDYNVGPSDNQDPDPSTFTANPPLPLGQAQEYATYLPTPPQPSYASTFPPPGAGPQYTYPPFGDQGILQGTSSGSSPSAPPAGTSLSADPNLVYPNDVRVGFASDDSVPANYTFPTNPAAPAYIVSPSKAFPTPVSAQVQVRQHSARSDSAHIVSTPGGSASTSASTPGSHHAPPGSAAMYAETANLRYTADINESDPVEGLTERLGEFLFSPVEDSNTNTTQQQQEQGDEEWTKKRRTNMQQSSQWTSGGRAKNETASRTALFQSRMETDGLRDEHRNLLLDCFLAHSRLFFEMSVPRFRYRMTFHDRRRPSLALLNAMYLWATRMTNSPGLSAMEAHFFSEACRHLDSAGPNSDRLIDAVRAAMLLCAYSYTNGRHHEGWLVAGLAVRLVLSTGVHQISSLTFRHPPPQSPFLRNRVHLLPPPEDAIELAERVHAFWCVYAIERCGALATGFPSSLRDEDITTPFGRPLDDIASQSVTIQDDVTVKDLYLGQAFARSTGDSPYMRWIKAVTILERASKLAFLTPADDSEYALRWSEYASLGPSLDRAPPPAWLNQPKYRNPTDYNECAVALKHYVETLGEDGIWPVERRRAAEREGVAKPDIKSHTILLHHQIVAVEMLMHDINALDVENDAAVAAGRESADLLRQLPPIPFNEIDAQVILVWCMITKVLIKEMRRHAQLGDYTSTQSVEEDVDVIIKEMSRIGSTMHLARVQCKAMEELKKAALVI